MIPIDDAPNPQIRSPCTIQLDNNISVSLIKPLPFLLLRPLPEASRLDPSLSVFTKTTVLLGFKTGSSHPSPLILGWIIVLKDLGYCGKDICFDLTISFPHFK